MKPEELGVSAGFGASLMHAVLALTWATSSMDGDPSAHYAYLQQEIDPFDKDITFFESWGLSMALTLVCLFIVLARKERDQYNT